MGPEQTAVVNEKYRFDGGERAITGSQWRSVSRGVAYIPGGPRCCGSVVMEDAGRPASRELQ